MLPLRTNALWTLTGNGVYMASQWGMLVALAKLGSPQLVGRFALALAVAAPAIQCANLGLRAVVATDATNQYCFADYFGLRVLTASLALLAIAGIATAGYGWETASLIMVIGLAKTFESISDIIYGLAQKHERMDRVAISMVLKGLLSLAALTVTLYLSRSILCAAVSLTATWAVILLFYDLRNAAWILQPMALAQSGTNARINQQYNHVWPRWQSRALKPILKLSLPLGAVMFLVSLNMNIPRYFVERYLGQAALGVFASMAYGMIAGAAVVAALGLAAQPRLAKYYSSGQHDAFRKLLGKLAGVAGVLGAAGIALAFFVGRQLLTFFYGPEYAQYPFVFVSLMLAAAVTYVASLLCCAMSAARYFRIQAPLFAVVVATNALSCRWLIPLAGLQGAAIALVVSALVQVIGAALIIMYALQHRATHCSL